MDLIISVAKGKMPSDEDLKKQLYEICYCIHSNCNNECPVYRMNGSRTPNNLQTNYGCDCFKDGTAMLEFIRSI